MFSKKELVKIPQTTGIYIFKNKNNQVIYVGKALRLRERIKSYFQKQEYPKNRLLVEEIANYQLIEVFSEVEALILEANLVKKYLPKYNISLRDDKGFLYIAITKEEFPRVSACRKSGFGPFPNASAVRSVLKLLRRIFPYCTQSPKAKKPCFYSQINLCAPCPALIKTKTGEEYAFLRKKYLKNIRSIREVLQGNIAKLKSDLLISINQHAQKEEFEEASLLKKQLEQLIYITRPYYKISHFLSEPNFYQNEKNKALLDLVAVLKSFYPQLVKINKIEGYDIANLAGGEATASMVVFIDGEKETSEYKRFKITVKGPNDTAMLKEVLTRRLAHDDWQYPDLILIDGGKPQVAAADSVVKNIPLLGISKRYETFVIKTQNNFKEIKLAENSSALRLIQEIRDEAHRFSRKYHHLLRKKLLSF